MNISQKLECLKLAIDLVKIDHSPSHEAKPDLISVVTSTYKSLCGLVNAVDLDDPSTYVDLVDELVEVAS